MQCIHEKGGFALDMLFNYSNFVLIHFQKLKQAVQSLSEHRGKNGEGAEQLKSPNSPIVVNNVPFDPQQYTNKEKMASTEIAQTWEDHWRESVWA